MKLPFRRAALGVVLALGMLGVVPGVVFAAQPSCGDTLTSDTTLTADLDCSAYGGNALTLGSNRVVLNLNGHTITGPTGSDGYYGVDTDGYNNARIKNGTIENFYIGIYVDSSSGTEIKNLKIIGEGYATASVEYGIYGYYAAATLVDNVDIDPPQYGMYFEYGASNKVMNSTVAGDSIAIYTYYETEDRFINNDLMAPDYGFYDEGSGGNRLIGNTSNGGDYGFYLYCYSYGDIILRNNVANNNSSYGFYIYECYGNQSWAPGTGSQITGNVANNNGNGFYDYYSINSVWMNNIANDNDGDGFYIDYPSGYVMKYNVAKRNGDSGFEFDNNSYGSGYYNAKTVSYNTANKNSYGFYSNDVAVPGKGNVARQNTSWNCYLVQCN